MIDISTPKLSALKAQYLLELIGEQTVRASINAGERGQVSVFFTEAEAQRLLFIRWLHWPTRMVRAAMAS